MQKTKIKVAVVFIILSLSLPFTTEEFAFADGNEDLLLKRIDVLEKKIEMLEEKLAGKEVAVTSKDIEDIVDEKLEKGKMKFPEIPEFLRKVTLSGFVDAAYTYNFGHQDTRTNTARVFDTEANNFNLQAAELVLERVPPAEGGVGFRTDLFFGEDAEIITPTGSTRDEFDLQQAYISFKPHLNFNLPLGNWQWIRVGKFVTMHGAEVIEAKDNWNFSRSLLFGYAIPFTHTGIRVGYDLFDGLSGYLGVNNGWDNVKDNNNGKSVEMSLSWALLDNFTFGINTMHGPEQTSNDHNLRSLYDFVAQYKPFDKLSLMLNYDYATEEDVTTDGDDAVWQGVAGYIKYDLFDWLSLVNRTEFFDDRQGVRVTSGTPQELWENTFTIELRPYKELIARLEYRHDESDKNVFTQGVEAVDSQDTFALELIYPF